LQKARRGAGLGVMLVEQGGAADEGGGDSPSSSALLQLVGVLGGDDVGGQLRQRAGVVRPAELAVVFGLLGCFGSIPGSPRLGR
jgi:hypothetical protein